MLRDQLLTRRDPAPYLDGVTVEEWWELVNGRVYFFSQERPLKRLLASYAERGYGQEVIKFRTEALLAPVAASVEVTTVNAGVFPRQAGPCRGRMTFIPLSDFPASDWSDIKEVTVSCPVPVSEEAIHSVVDHGPDGSARRLWTRATP